MNTRYGICNLKRAKEYGTDIVILGERHNDDWVDFSPENEYLYNFWLTEKQARGYIEQFELEDCEVIELEISYLK